MRLLGFLCIADLLRDSFSLAVVEVEPIQAQREHAGGVYPPKVGNLEDAIGEVF